MGDKKKILIVDDDAEIRQLLGDFLKKYEYQTVTAADGQAMFAVLEKQTVDLIVLDVMLPGADGFELCKQLRSKRNTPIVMLTAVGDDTDRIIGLELGADDYLTKPFNPRELLARIKAVLRRSEQAGKAPKNKHDIWVFQGWRLDLGNRRLSSAEDVEVSLTSGEYDLLLALLESPQQILSRDQLLECTHARSAGPFDRSIDIQISRLRQKLEVDPKNPSLIKTVRGGGYMLAVSVEVITRC